VSDEQLAKTNALRLLMAAYARSEDLIRIGAYQKGTDPALDSAITNLPTLNAFLQQKPHDLGSLKSTVDRLMTLPS
jgi:flagellum-specific ATP synthase